MADETRVVARADGDRRHLEGLEHRGDEGAAAEGDGRIEDARVHLVDAEEVDRHLAIRDGLHVVPTTLGPQREAAYGSTVADRSDHACADELVAGVEGHPLAVHERQRIGRRRQGGVGECEVAPVDRQDVRDGLEVDLLDGGHSLFSFLGRGLPQVPAPER